MNLLAAFRHWSIGRKLTILFLIAIILPAAIMLIPAASQRISALKQENRSRLNMLGPYEVNRANQTLDNTASELENLLRTYLTVNQVEEYLYRAPTTMSDEDRAQLERSMQARLIRLQSNAQSVVRIRLYDNQGGHLYDTREDDTRDLSTPADALVTSDTLETKFMISSIYADDLGHPAIDFTFHFPLDNFNLSIGYVVFTQDLTLASVDRFLPDLYTILQDYPASEWETHVFVLDDAGNLISTTPEQALFTDFSASQGFKNAGAGTTGTSTYYSPQLGTDVLGYHATHTITNGPTYTFLVETPTDQINNQALEQVMFTLVPITLGSIVLALGVAFIANMMIVRPLTQLTDAAQRIGAREPNVKLPEYAHQDEIGVLNSAFGEMIMQLDELINTLEDRVKRRTQQLEIARNEAEKANRVKSQFLANMSHELRTPLNAILNFTSFVLQGFMGPVTDEQVEALNTVSTSGDHLLNLINDVLDIAKIEVGKMDLFIEEVDLNVELKGVVSIAQGLLQDKPVELITDIEPSLPKLRGDSRRLHQVFLNLLSNAVKFTSEGSITLAAHRHANEVKVMVRDTGVGIAPEDQDLVFQAFEQTEQGIKYGGGTGLGLPISKHFVEAHGGRMWVESAVGTGSTFYVSLPLEQDQPVAAI